MVIVPEWTIVVPEWTIGWNIFFEKKKKDSKCWSREWVWVIDPKTRQGTDRKETGENYNKRWKQTGNGYITWSLLGVTVHKRRWVWTICLTDLNSYWLKRINPFLSHESKPVLPNSLHTLSNFNPVCAFQFVVFS